MTLYQYSITYMGLNQLSLKNYNRFNRIGGFILSRLRHCCRPCGFIVRTMQTQLTVTRKNLIKTRSINNGILVTLSKLKPGFQTFTARFQRHFAQRGRAGRRSRAVVRGVHKSGFNGAAAQFLFCSLKYKAKLKGRSEYNRMADIWQ